MNPDSGFGITIDYPIDPCIGVVPPDVQAYLDVNNLTLFFDPLTSRCQVKGKYGMGHLLAAGAAGVALGFFMGREGK